MSVCLTTIHQSRFLIRSLPHVPNQFQRLSLMKVKKVRQTVIYLSPLEELTSHLLALL